MNNNNAVISDEVVQEISREMVMMIAADNFADCIYSGGMINAPVEGWGITLTKEGLWEVLHKPTGSVFGPPVECAHDCLQWMLSNIYDLQTIVENKPLS